jgi:ubiquinone/menaquinone biosynthesis C-methylase UbiE
MDSNITYSNLESQLQDTRRAFDSVAADYDGPLGNNALIQRMRGAMWRTLGKLFLPGSRLLDLGCGTGIDAVHLAARGYEIVATDWSPEMVERARRRAAQASLSHRVTVELIGAHELARLSGQAFDGIYSDLGPLNCVPDLEVVSGMCAALLKPRSTLVVSVMGRHCPWEWAYYAARGDLSRAQLRGARDAVPVNLNRHTVWTRYYTPREFYGAFAHEFELTHYRALGLFLPPPYLIRGYERGRAIFAALGWLDDRLGGWPVLRDAGDHFLMVLTRRD